MFTFILLLGLFAYLIYKGYYLAEYKDNAWGVPIVFVSVVMFMLLLVGTLAGGFFDKNISTSTQQFSKALTTDKTRVIIVYGESLYSFTTAQVVNKFDSITNITVTQNFNLFGSLLHEQIVLSIP